MTIYADVLVIVNLYLDFFLLWCTRSFLGLRSGNGRLALGALTGAACSFTALLPVESAWLSLLLGVVTSLLVTIAAFAPLRLGPFLQAALCFWAFSLLLAGTFLFLLRFFAPGRVAVLGSVVYFDLSLPLLFLFTCLAYLVFSLARRLLPKEPQSLNCRWFLIEHRGARVRLYIKQDTGNSLREPFSGLPVIVCDQASLAGLVPPEIENFLETGACEESRSLRLVPFQTVGGTGLLPAFRPDRVTEEKTGACLRCYLAVCPRPLSSGQFQAIYNPELLTDP